MQDVDTPVVSWMPDTDGLMVGAAIPDGPAGPVLAEVDGRRVVRSDVSGDQLSTVGTWSSSSNPAAEVTVWAVARLRAFNNRVLVNAGAGGAHLIGDSSENWRIRVVDSIAPTPAVLDEWAVLVARFAGDGTGTLRVNGTEFSGPVATRAVNNQAIGLFGNAGAGGASPADLAAVTVVDGLTSPAEDAAFEAWANGLYGGGA